MLIVDCGMTMCPDCRRWIYLLPVYHYYTEGGLCSRIKEIGFAVHNNQSKLIKVRWKVWFFIHSYN